MKTREERIMEMKKEVMEELVEEKKMLMGIEDSGLLEEKEWVREEYNKLKEKYDEKLENYKSVK